MSMKSPEFWSNVDMWFGEISKTFQQFRFEERDEAINKSSPQWLDDSVGISIDSWNMIRYRKTDDREILEDCFKHGNSLLPSLEKLINNRELSEEFVNKWSMLNYCFGFVQSSYFSTSEDMSGERRARSLKDKKSVVNITHGQKQLTRGNLVPMCWAKNSRLQEYGWNMAL